MTVERFKVLLPYPPGRVHVHGPEWVVRACEHDAAMAEVNAEACRWARIAGERTRLIDELTERLGACTCHHRGPDPLNQGDPRCPIHGSAAFVADTNALTAPNGENASESGAGGGTRTPDPRITNEIDHPKSVAFPKETEGASRDE